MTPRSSFDDVIPFALGRLEFFPPRIPLFKPRDTHKEHTQTHKHTQTPASGAEMPERKLGKTRLNKQSHIFFLFMIRTKVQQGSFSYLISWLKTCMNKNRKNRGGQRSVAGRASGFPHRPPFLCLPSPSPPGPVRSAANWVTSQVNTTGEGLLVNLALTGRVSYFFPRFPRFSVPLFSRCLSTETEKICK